MNTRGAPAIAITGCLALAVELTNLNFDSITAFDQFVTEKLGNARTKMRPLLYECSYSELMVRLFGNSKTNCCQYE